MTTVSTVAALKEALRNGEETIEIEEELAKKTIRLRSIGTLAWAITFIAMGVLFYLVLTVTSTPPSPARTITLVIAMGVIFISVAAAGGDIYTLFKMRAYEEISRTENTLLLEKK